MSNKVLLEGYAFELVDFVSAQGMTTVTVRVSGNGRNKEDLSRWVLEVCPGDPERFTDEINIISCEKRRPASTWLPAIAQKTTYELTGDIGITGVMIEEWIGKDIEDPPVEFRITLDQETVPEPARVAFISGETVYQSIEKMHVDSSRGMSSKIWRTPIEHPFCLYIVVPDGYKPVNACKVNISITKRGACLVHEHGAFDIEDAGADTTGEIPTRAVKTDIVGCVKVIASVPLKSHQACGDSVEATACDCFEMYETIGYSTEQDKFEIRDVSICPKKKSIDLTLLNAHCGKSVYRLDGKFVIDCKRCK